MNYNNLISLNNLELAWRRITTGTNIPYKFFFRHIYLAYEIGKNSNLKQLHQKLKGSWKPQRPIRIYIPKPSGLQRPISILSLDDQIVLQAIANVVAKKMYKKRKNIENKVVFSNILNTPKDSIFFLKDWHATYNLYQKKSEDYFSKGNRWIAHFDLAAFYDTISHRLLIKTVFPRDGHAAVWAKIQKWLQCWSTARESYVVDHGIPQGPIASDFLAECLLLSLDEKLMRNGLNYIRYVDDIRIFCKSQLEAQKAAVKLEVICRNLGLIPQGKKFAIGEVKKIDEPFFKMLPSIPSDEPSDDDIDNLTSQEAEKIFDSAVTGRPSRITDKSKIRYVLFRAPKSRKILGKVIKLLLRHPEHIDAFSAFFRNYKKNASIEKVVRRGIIEGTPYDYVRGALWQTLARICSVQILSEMLPLARKDLQKKDGCIVLKWGVISFLLRCQRHGITSYSRRIKHQNPLVQSLLVAILPDSEYRKNRLVDDILKSKNVEPIMVLGEQLLKRNQTLKDYSIKAHQLPVSAANVWRGLGLVRRKFSKKSDIIGEIIPQRYAVRKVSIWRSLLGAQYTHALQILLQADALYDSGRSSWMQEQNSFNDAVCRSLINFLKNKQLPGGQNILISSQNGKIIKFGVLLDRNQDFASQHRVIADHLRDFNNRRNALPGSHPYEENTGDQTDYLKAREQKRFANSLSIAYKEIIDLVERSR
ncbi:RNA-directed DNA polymerase [Patescibacteria group bacterium]|nr:RNA-directed DNA polymerase [Patescibacteria group bacterium]